MEPRALAVARERHPGAPLLMRASGGKEGSDARPLLTDAGYAPARWFTDMARPLPGPAVAAVPDPRIRPFGDDVSEATRLAHNEAFAGHWGSTARTREAWDEMVSARSFRAADSRVVVEDGVVLAYVLCGQWVERELYISLVGTRPEARGQGLGRAALVTTVADAAASGRYDVVDLSVDSDNPTGAGGLYASAGFGPVARVGTVTRRAATPWRPVARRGGGAVSGGRRCPCGGARRRSRSRRRPRRRRPARRRRRHRSRRPRARGRPRSPAGQRRRSRCPRAARARRRAPRLPRRR